MADTEDVTNQLLRIFRMSIKVTWDKGSKIIKSAGINCQELVDIISQSTNFSSRSIQLIYGFPPKQIFGAANDLADTLIKPGSVVSIREGTPPSIPVVISAVDNTTTSDLMRVLLETGYDRSVAEEAIIISGDNIDNYEIALEVCAQLSGGELSSTSLAGADTRLIHRRVIEADNSCLFNAIGYLILNGRDHSTQLRSLIADNVLANPITYSEGFLGNPK